MRYIDITRSLSESTAVWPGDQRVEWTWTARREEGSTVNLGAITTSVHAATHADAPLHFDDSGKAIDEVPLRPFLGPAEVVHVDDDVISPEHVQAVSAPRVLFKTCASSVDRTQWPNAVTAVHPDTIRMLGERGVVLIGTDAPSIDPLDSKHLEAHHALAETGMVNLEGLQLAGVSPGRYHLTALPLKIERADAAPVRAVLQPVSVEPGGRE
ncbi:kynurenine formamidase [Longibacter salinarum]|uniref:Kynurenine formamidase n=1 Tax=Longibacter salinarum TaxID=1850348 RepID=A0A2A8D2G0_9BACT|nr:cyclase family protein [Longibacter salinarum]PEN15070.1 kynurenine formamidase [Longibacter salinarum]